jgi:hypothetical protein
MTQPGESDTRELVWVAPEPSGLVRVQLSLDAPAHLLGAVRARTIITLRGPTETMQRVVLGEGTARELALWLQ